MTNVTVSAGRLRATKIIRPPTFSLYRLLGSIKELIAYRDLILTLCVHRIKVRYSQSVLGWAWAVLQPLALMAIYTVIFSVFTRISSEGVPYALFVYAALLPWTYFSTMLTTASGSLTKHTQLITKVYFPREILPITYIVVGLFDLAIAGCLLGALMIYYHVPVGWHVLGIVPVLGIITALGAALTLVFAALGVRFRDIELAMPLLMQVWMLATPVVYPLSSVPEWLRPYYILNPMAGAIENFRRILLGNEPPDYVALRMAFGVAMILLPGAYVFFKQREASMADII